MGVSIGAWLLLALGGVCAGFSKTAVAGAATLAVAIFALILPARESTGVLLLLLIVGDLVSISIYRRDARWDIIVRLIGPVLVGIGLGAVFLSRVDGVVMRRTIGWILLALTGFQLYLGRRALRRGAAQWLRPGAERHDGGPPGGRGRREPAARALRRNDPHQP